MSETAIEQPAIGQKLVEVMVRFAAQAGDIATNATTPELEAGARAWKDFLLATSDLGTFDAIDAVNRSMNGVAYRSDAKSYEMRDHWATPFEFLASGGDCEDFALAKYFALRQLGMDAADLRIVVGFDKPLSTAHAILMVRDGATVYLLDNLQEQIVATEAGARFKPFFSLNEQGVWLYRTI